MKYYEVGPFGNLVERDTEYEEPRRPFSQRFTMDVDYNFWKLLPQLSLNFHTDELEIGWLCFELAICWRKQ